MKVLIVASSKFPVPAVKGGAVPNLIEELIKENQNQGLLELSCCSLYDAEAEIESVKYTATKFIWAKTPKWISFLDKVFYFLLSKILRIKRLHSLSFLFQVIWFSFFTGKILKRGNYDKVVFENSVPMMFAVKLYGNSKRYRNKYYLHMHSVPRKYYGNAKVIRNCKSVICVSRYVADAMLEDKRLGIDRNKMQVMYNCLDTGRFNPDIILSFNVRKKYEIPENKKIVLFVGRLCKEKGIEEFLSAVKELNRKDYVCLIVGSNFYKSEIVSPYEHKLRDISVDIQDKLVFTGYIDYDFIPAVYKASDVVVLPSMWDEPAGMTIIEAMACGKPVITTKSGGIPEYTGNGTCILLDRNPDIVEKIRESIDIISDNESYCLEISHKAAERAAMFSQTYYYQQFIELLNKD